MKQRGFLIGWQLAAVGILAAIAIAYVAMIRIQLSNCRTDLAEFKHAYDILSRSVITQNAEVNRWKDEAEKARQRSATARTKAAPVVEASKRSAESLGAAMRGLRPSECPTAKAVEVVRGDLGGR